MNETTKQLVDELAQKLGTTTEYLWQVLLRQAPIDATVTLFQVVLLILAGFGLYRLHKMFTKNDQYYSFDGLPWIMGASFAVWIGFTVIAFNQLPYIISGYCNPEYWALQKVLGTLSK